MLNFDPVSELWQAFWGQDSKTLMLPSSTAAEADAWLAAAKQECLQNNGRILFVGVLDEDRQQWDDFLGRRIGIPFNLLDDYRARAIVLRKYAVGRNSLTLRAYQ
jgi:hypothetical protein